MNNQPQLFNRKYLKKYRRKLRNNLTPAEATLWLHLKNKQLNARRFRRQFSVNNYILDFYCNKLNLKIRNLSVNYSNLQSQQFSSRSRQNNAIPVINK